MTTKTTVHLLPRPLDKLDQLSPTGLTITIFCLLVTVGAIGRIASPSAAVAVPTPSLPIVVIATAAPQVQQVAAAPVGNVTRRAIVVYGSPDASTAIGAVEPGRSFTPLAHYGPEWMQLDMAGSGVVFVRVADLYDLPAGLVDLKPAQIEVQPVYVSASEAPHAPVQAEPEAQPPAAAPTPAAVYDVANERQRNIQNRLVEPIFPTIAPMEMNPVNQEWARVQGCTEHPEWNC